MVAQLIVFFAVGLKAKVDHKQRHRLLGQFDPQVAVPKPIFGLDQLAVGGGPVGVRDHQIGRHDRTVGKGNARHHFFAALAADVNLANRSVVGDRAAQFLKLFHKALHQGTRATHGKVNAPGLFHKVDHGVDGGHGEGVAAHQQGLEAKHLAQLVALKVFAAKAKQVANRTQFQQVGGHLEHGAHGAKVGIAQL